MKQRHPHFHFCETYMMNYYYFLGWKWEDLAKYVKKHFNHALDPDRNPCGHTLRLTKDGGTIILIYTKEKNKLSTFAHEALHAANFTLDQKGWIGDLVNDEPQAYLMMEIIRKGLKE